MNILILNMTRMGDLIQTTPIIHEAKKRNPRCHITLVVGEAFAEICSFIEGVDRVLPFPMGRIHRLLKDGEIVRGYALLREVLDVINEREYDLLVNLTHSRVSAILMTLIRKRRVVGISIDSEGNAVFLGQWQRYFMNIVPNRLYNPFNICDLHLFMAGFGPCGEGLFLRTPEEFEKRADKILRSIGVDGREKILGIHPGASTEKKRWGAENFSFVAREAAKRGVRVVVFGSSGEKDLCERIVRDSGEGAISLAGKTTLGELVALIERCSLLLTNDTGPLHIATAVGTKAVEISLGEAYFRETGPYGEGHYVFEASISCHPCPFREGCSHMTCRQFVRPEAVWKVVSSLLDGEEVERLEDGGPFENLQVYRSRFSPEDGVLEYMPLIRRPLEERQFLLFLYRDLFLSDLGGEWETPLEGDPSRPLRNLEGGYDLSTLPGIVESLGEMCRRLTLLLGEAERGAALTKEVKKIISAEEKAGDERLEELLSELGSIDKSIINTGHAFPPLRPLTRYFQFEKISIDSDDPVIVADRTREAYESFIRRGKAFLRYVEEAETWAERFRIEEPVPIKGMSE
ncbi:MAG: glycosyltransferase family 9 protein [Deltaproteobacteria bacterium]|nr:MAG: glycosyltransferase family 9 protein [Deltaproteobacteria bacterium]